MTIECHSKADRDALLKMRVDVGTTRTLDNLAEYLGHLGKEPRLDGSHVAAISKLGPTATGGLMKNTAAVEASTTKTTQRWRDRRRGLPPSRKTVMLEGRYGDRV